MSNITEKDCKEWLIVRYFGAAEGYRISYKGIEVHLDLDYNPTHIFDDRPIQEAMPLYLEAKEILKKYKETHRIPINPEGVRGDEGSIVGCDEVEHVDILENGECIGQVLIINGAPRYDNEDIHQYLNQEQKEAHE